MFTLCDNAACAYAGWCKRFTYKISYPSAVDNGYPVKHFRCNIGEWYMKNKAREIYERDNPDDDIYEQFKRFQHEDHNWESRLWEDDDSDQGVEEHTTDWGGVSDPDSVLQLQCSGDRRSDNQGSEVTGSRERTEEAARALERLVAVFQDAPFNGFQLVRPFSGLADDRETNVGFFPDSGDSASESPSTEQD